MKHHHGENKTSSFRPAGDLIDRVLKNYSAVGAREVLFGNWQEIIGKNAHLAGIYRIKGHKLVVKVSDPCLLQELTLRRDEILRRIKERCGQGLITTVDFRYGRNS
jgi:predicted nucleic acid-binding Zn ribbon protein